MEHCLSPGWAVIPRPTSRSPDLDRTGPRSTPGVRGAPGGLPALAHAATLLLYGVSSFAGWVRTVAVRSGGSLDLAALKRAWERWSARHSILRTAFTSDGLREPSRSCWLSGADLGGPRLAGLSPNDQAERLSALLRADRDQKLIFASALTRMTVIRSPTRRTIWCGARIICILTDGRGRWSLKTCRPSTRPSAGVDAGLGAAPQYRDYIEWLRVGAYPSPKRSGGLRWMGMSAPTPFDIGDPQGGPRPSEPRR